MTHRALRLGKCALLAVLPLALVSCSSAKDDVAAAGSTTTIEGMASGATSSGALHVDADGTSAVAPDDLGGALNAIPVGTLTAAERDALPFMREEERLALDVYTALGQKWSLQPFTNISKAEATHTASVKTLLDRYGLADPMINRPTGTFENAKLQSLYDALVAKGSTSEVAALEVGAEIEELDIADLRARATTTPDIALVFANLEKGSRNHLRSFTSQLKQRGVTYVPVHLSQADVDAILAGAIERGNN